MRETLRDRRLLAGAAVLMLGAAGCGASASAANTASGKAGPATHLSRPAAEAHPFYRITSEGPNRVELIPNDYWLYNAPDNETVYLPTIAAFCLGTTLEEVTDMESVGNGGAGGDIAVIANFPGCATGVVTKSSLIGLAHNGAPSPGTAPQG